MLRIGAAMGVCSAPKPPFPHPLQAALTQLRKIAAIRGLVNDGVRPQRPLLAPRGCRRCLPCNPRCRPFPQLRARVWPLLVGVEATSQDVAEYEERHGSIHKDSSVVACDMARSLWSFTEGGPLGSSEACGQRRSLRDS